MAVPLKIGMPQVICRWPAGDDAAGVTGLLHGQTVHRRGRLIRVGQVAVAGEAGFRAADIQVIEVLFELAVALGSRVQAQPATHRVDGPTLTGGHGPASAAAATAVAAVVAHVLSVRHIVIGLSLQGLGGLEYNWAT